MADVVESQGKKHNDPRLHLFVVVSLVSSFQIRMWQSPLCPLPCVSARGSNTSPGGGGPRLCAASSSGGGVGVAKPSPVFRAGGLASLNNHEAQKHAESLRAYNYGICDALELILRFSMVKPRCEAMKSNLAAMACEGWETRPGANFCGTQYHRVTARLPRKHVI